MPRTPRRPSDPALSATIRVSDVPEILSRARWELAQLLRDAAAGEAPAVAARLHTIAAIFETGQRTDL
jgi:hypothetical protein